MNSAQKNLLPRISRILVVEPFKITALWSTGEIRRNDFEPLFEQWKQEHDTRLYELFDSEVFKQVAVSPTRTLHWPTVMTTIDLGRRRVTGPIDLDPDELYRQSSLIRKTEKLSVGSILRKARQEAGLSQLELASKSGTSRHYISRIENGKSDIQLETLNKIVQLGMGKQVRVEIA